MRFGACARSCVKLLRVPFPPPRQPPPRYRSANFERDRRHGARQNGVWRDVPLRPVRIGSCQRFGVCPAAATTAAFWHCRWSDLRRTAQQTSAASGAMCSDTPAAVPARQSFQDTRIPRLPTARRGHWRFRGASPARGVRPAGPGQRRCFCDNHKASAGCRARAGACRKRSSASRQQPMDRAGEPASRTYPSTCSLV
jgi:hypothetical protein